MKQKTTYENVIASRASLDSPEAQKIQQKIQKYGKNVFLTTKEKIIAKTLNLL